MYCNSALFASQKRECCALRTAALRSARMVTKRGPKPKPASMNASEAVSVRVLPAEKRALEALVVLRAKEQRARGEVPDETLAGWIRAIIRREAKAAGIKVD
jgi:hypothetical protein